MTDDDLKHLLEANATRIEGAIDGKTNAIEQRMDLGFADTQAMIKFSHAELDRRVRYMEQTLQTFGRSIRRPADARRPPRRSDKNRELGFQRNFGKLSS